MSDRSTATPAYHGPRWCLQKSRWRKEQRDYGPSSSLARVTEVIAKLKVRGSAKGVSRHAIKAALGSGVNEVRVNNTLRKGVAKGWLLQVKGSYKVVKPTRKQRFLQFTKALAYARSLKLQRQCQWMAWCKRDTRPANIPVCPHSVYRNKGWQGWEHWLGLTDRLEIESSVSSTHPLIPPSRWKTATAPNGRVYHWHTETRQVRWEAPTKDTPLTWGQLGVKSSAADNPDTPSRATSTQTQSRESNGADQAAKPRPNMIDGKTMQLLPPLPRLQQLQQLTPGAGFAAAKPRNLVTSFESMLSSWSPHEALAAGGTKEHRSPPLTTIILQADTDLEDTTVLAERHLRDVSAKSSAVGVTYKGLTALANCTSTMTGVSERSVAKTVTQAEAVTQCNSITASAKQAAVEPARGQEFAAHASTAEQVESIIVTMRTDAMRSKMIPAWPMRPSGSVQKNSTHDAHNPITIGMRTESKLAPPSAPGFQLPSLMLSFQHKVKATSLPGVVGMGAFAATHAPKDAYLGEYRGKVLSLKTAEKVNHTNAHVHVGPRHTCILCWHRISTI